MKELLFIQNGFIVKIPVNKHQMAHSRGSKLFGYSHVSEMPRYLQCDL